MARPRKWKNVCALPPINEFLTYGAPGAPVPSQIMTVEEYEVIRLIDKADMTQEECAVQMGVSRPTVQIIYNSARKKLADYLTGGGRLRIGGGDYRLCEERHAHCEPEYCRRYGCRVRSGG
ncbi:MAG: DUF134 domain-containing protein [Eubacteriales bacterium]|nr:DUF134 domain-containing protein [Eubacteriales bacterium]